MTKLLKDLPAARKADEAARARKWVMQAQGIHDFTQCHCIGPQNGEPVCPCAMRSVTVFNGRYIKTMDLGPASAQGEPHE